MFDTATTEAAKQIVTRIKEMIAADGEVADYDFSWSIRRSTILYPDGLGEFNRDLSDLIPIDADIIDKWRQGRLLPRSEYRRDYLNQLIRLLEERFSLRP